MQGINLENVVPRVVRVLDLGEMFFLETSASKLKGPIPCPISDCVFNRHAECGYAKSPNLTTMSKGQRLPPSRTGQEICPAGVHYVGGTTRHA